MNRWVQDIRYSLRQMRKSPGFTAMGVIVVALGIGSATGMLAIVQSVLVRPLNYPYPEQLMLVGLSNAPSSQLASDIPLYLQMKKELSAFSGLAAYRSMPVPVKTQDGTRMAFAPQVTANFFDVLGVTPQNGRAFHEGERLEAVVSADFWRSTLHARKDVLGSTLEVSGSFYTVVGVMPPGFNSPNGGSLWTVLDPDAKGAFTQGVDGVSVLGRLKAGTTPEAAEQEGEAFVRQLPKHEVSDHLWLYPYSRTITGEERPALLALLGACFLLLLIAVVNTANLQIARATGREAEIVTRTALGATRAHIIRQILTESLILSAAGAIVGWLFVSVMLRLARDWFAWLPRFDELRPDPWTFAACAALAILCGVAVAVAPVFRLLPAAKRLSLLHTALGTSTTTRSQRLSIVLISAEISLTCMLLVAATLLLRTFSAIEHAPLGFQPENVTTFLLWPVRPNLPISTAQVSFHEVLDRLEHVAGVRAAGMVTSLPLSNFSFSLDGTFSIPGHVSSNVQYTTQLGVASPDYFQAMSIPILQGRSFSAGDMPDTSLVGVVNRTFARRYLAQTNPMGQQVRLDKYAQFSAPITIVGVYGDVIQGDNLGQPPDPTIMISYLQLPPSSPIAHMMIGLAPGFAVQAEGAQQGLPSLIQSIVKEDAPEFALGEVSSMNAAIDGHLRTRRIALQLSSIFGGLALMLSMAGVYGVLAYLTGQRTREIGIRLALGATRDTIVFFVLRLGLLAVISGMTVGIAGAMFACRWIRAFLYGVSTYDPLSYLLVSGLLVAASVGAILIPARRAAKVDPMVALRYE